MSTKELYRFRIDYKISRKGPKFSTKEFPEIEEIAARFIKGTTRSTPIEKKMSILMELFDRIKGPWMTGKKGRQRWAAANTLEILSIAMGPECRSRLRREVKKLPILQQKQLRVLEPRQPNNIAIAFGNSYNRYLRTASIWVDYERSYFGGP